MITKIDQVYARMLLEIGLGCGECADMLDVGEDEVWQLLEQLVEQQRIDCEDLVGPNNLSME
jgi:hypothetical protein